MATDIFEKSVINFRGRITSGHKKATRATFKVFKNGAAFAAPSAPLKDGACELPWTVPDVPDGDEHYTLTFKMEIEGVEYNITDAYKVWPRWVHLAALRVSDLKPFQRFKIHAKQPGVDDLTITDAKGECMVFLKKPAALEVTAEAPGEIKEWVVARGRKRIFKALRKYKAAFVAPAKPADDNAIEQRVNLTTTDRGRDKRASLVEVKVGADGDVTRAPDARIGHEGDVIFVKARFGRESKRNMPLPSISGALEIAHTPDGKQYTAKVKLGAKGEPAAFKLALGLAGGDTCELSIGSTSACSDAKIKFVNWRKLYYQLTLPSGLAAPDMSFIEGGLQNVKVKYKKYKTVTFAEGDAPAAPRGSWFDGPMVSGTLAGRCVNIGNHNRGFFHAKFVDTHNPVGVHVLVCHAQFDGGIGNAQRAHFKSRPITKASPKAKFPVGSATVVSGWHFKASVAGAVFEMAFQDGGTGWRNARWKTLDATGPNAGKSGAFADDHVSVKWRTKANVVSLKLPADAVALLDADATLEVSVDVYHSLGPYNGEADNNRQLIRTRAASEGGDKAMNGTMTHELGHTMKQVLYNVPPGLAAGDHGRMYAGRGHSGNHCADGLPAALYNGAGDLGGREDCTCVMYGEGASARPVAFCARCSPFVIAEDLSDIT